MGIFPGVHSPDSVHPTPSANPGTYAVSPQPRPWSGSGRICPACLVASPAASASRRGTAPRQRAAARPTAPSGRRARWRTCGSRRAACPRRCSSCMSSCGCEHEQNTGRFKALKTGTQSRFSYMSRHLWGKSSNFSLMTDAWCLPSIVMLCFKRTNKQLDYSKVLHTPPRPTPT